MCDGASEPKILIAIPCFNEASHIEHLVQELDRNTRHLNAKIVVADGGSNDGTLTILDRLKDTIPRLHVIANPDRIQAAGINLIVALYGDHADFLIRIDAHGYYPTDYCDQLLAEAEKTTADSVVVSMHTIGRTLTEAVNATAQNSKFGNGGALHRLTPQGGWVDHGHHALMRLSAFKAVGGYDETFAINEDAELDYRLNQAGYRIWLTVETRKTYYPRSSFSSLARQYRAYGGGRARNLLKHWVKPKIRQLLPLMVFPSALLCLLFPWFWGAALPFFLWLASCLGFGLLKMITSSRLLYFLCGWAVAVMHLAWSFGFWQQLIACCFQSGGFNARR